MRDKHYIAFVDIKMAWNTAGMQNETEVLMFEQPIMPTITEVEEEAKSIHKLAVRINVTSVAEISHEVFLRNIADSDWQLNEDA